MKKIISIFALSALSATSLFAIEKVDLKVEFKADQEEALVSLVRAWIKPESSDVLLDKLSELISADTRYRQVVGNTGLVTKLFAASDSKNKNISSIDKLNLFMMAFYKETKGLEVDTRSAFSKAPYSVNR